VVAFLVESGAFPPERLSAAGYGEFHPRVANDSAENRARNRRTDIVILDAVAGAAEAGHDDGDDDADVVSGSSGTTKSATAGNGR
jgi:chemotaxis protein MotB